MPDRPAPSTRRAALLLLVALFAASGAAALVYEIVWFQLLELVIGSTAVSLAWLLASFMGGLCLGSLGAPRVVRAGWHPLRVVAALEVGIALLGLLFLIVAPWLGQQYLAWTGAGTSDLMLRGALCAACLLPAAMLMGATLPVVARAVETLPRGERWLGWCYGANTLGAVVGCLLAGFYLLPQFDLNLATYAAAALNLLVAAGSLWLSRYWSYAAPSAEVAEPSADAGPNSLPIYFAIGLSGLTALGAEVIWTRLAAIVLGATTYTFTIVLAVFLAGLALGSGLGASALGRLKRPAAALATCQLLLAAALVWGAWSVAHAFPYLPLERDLERELVRSIVRDVLRCVPALLPGALLWGASFPLAIAALQVAAPLTSQRVGRLYAVNTAGAIVGALGASLFIVPWLGTVAAQQVLIAMAALSAVAVGASELWPRRALAVLGTLVVTAIAAVCILGVPSMSFETIAYGRLAPWMNNKLTELYRGEGLNATVAVAEDAHGVRSFHVSGKPEASSGEHDLRLQRLLAALPAMLHPQPRSSLVVGFGSGATAGGLLPFVELRQVTVCEIEPLIPEVVSHYFSTINLGVATDPATRLICDDARHFLFTTPDRFDVITSDPIHPWVKGAATLYTVEYVEQVRRHLQPGGVAALWVPLYETNVAAVKSEIASFVKVFPHATLWTNASAGGSYDLVLIGSEKPIGVDLDQWEDRFHQPAYRFVREMLAEVGINSAIELAARFAGTAQDLEPWLANAQLNEDRNLRLQYLAGLTPRAADYQDIHRQILSYRHSDGGLFTGSAENREQWRAALATAP